MGGSRIKKFKMSRKEPVKVYRTSVGCRGFVVCLDLEKRSDGLVK